MKKLISSESVFEGHPDKVCDQISDAILDEILKEDKKARVAVEVAIKSNQVYILGEVTTTANIDYELVAKRVLLDIGYCQEFNIHCNLTEQSPDIALGVDERTNKSQGAGDQGMMYGYATNETPELMPAPLVLAHKIAKEFKKLRTTKYFALFGPDGKCQVTYIYENDKPVAIDTIIISAQTTRHANMDVVRKVIIEEILTPLVFDVEDIKVLINPTGEFIIGGPEADAGLTGRKIIVDTYGGFSHHGGGAFSGKDTSKVDRSAAYYARYAAKAFVAAGLADRCEVGVAYSIGIAEPVSLYIDSFGTGVISDDELLQLLRTKFDFTPTNIRKELELDQVKFRELSHFGHVGRIDLDVKWENVDSKVEELLKVYDE